MKAQIAGVLAVGAVVAAIAAYGGGQAGPQARPDSAELRLQLGALEKRVAALEERLRRQPLAGALAIPPLAPLAQPLPKGWQQREFNGMPYYLVPAQEVPGRPLQPAK